MIGGRAQPGTARHHGRESSVDQPEGVQVVAVEERGKEPGVAVGRIAVGQDGAQLVLVVELPATTTTVSPTRVQARPGSAPGPCSTVAENAWTDSASPTSARSARVATGPSGARPPPA